MGNSKKYDLIVVGTGFASTFFLKKYLEKTSEKKRVLVLERGQLYTHADRIQSVKGHLPAYNDLLASSNETFINKSPAKPWIFDVNFGGSSNCWWACTPRLMPNDFQLFTKYGQGKDWPVSYDQLEKYYCEAETIMHISGPVKTPFSKSQQYPLPAHALNLIDRTMQSHAGDTNWISQPTGRPSVPVAHRPGCCSSYSCNLCPVNSKFTIENSLKSVYEDPRVELRYGTQVYKLDIRNSVAQGVVTVPTNSNPANIHSETFEGETIVLGANPIFNAHILLNSGDSNPLTGAGLAEQKGLFANIHLDHFDNVGGNSSITANGYMLYDGNFRKDYASCLIENHNIPTLIRNELHKWRKIIRLKFVFECLADDRNRVTLSDNILKPLVEHQYHDESYIEKALIATRRQLKDILAPLNPVDVKLDEKFVDTECHVLSSVRMGKSVSDSVVDSSLIHHSYRNLFVLGGSAFPTVSAANPTLTISALSLRAADLNF